jgi:rhodanese-related sulfurtransferase
MSQSPYLLATPTEALGLNQAGEHLFIDVRTEADFDAGHVPGSYNVPIYFKGPGGAQVNLDFLDTMLRHFDKQAALVFV